MLSNKLSKLERLRNLNYNSEEFVSIGEVTTTNFSLNKSDKHWENQELDLIFLITIITMSQ